MFSTSIETFCVYVCFSSIELPWALLDSSSQWSNTMLSIVQLCKLSTLGLLHDSYNSCNGWPLSWQQISQRSAGTPLLNYNGQLLQTTFLLSTQFTFLIRDMRDPSIPKKCYSVQHTKCHSQPWQRETSILHWHSQSTMTWSTKTRPTTHRHFTLKNRIPTWWMPLWCWLVDFKYPVPQSFTAFSVQHARKTRTKLINKHKHTNSVHLQIHIIHRTVTQQYRAFFALLTL